WSSTQRTGWQGPALGIFDGIHVLNTIGKIAARLEKANRSFLKRFPGDSNERQPVHVVYGGAHLFKSDSAQKLGSLALKSLEQFAPNSATLARVLKLPNALAEAVYSRVLEKLRREPVECYHLDFEDGYGIRSKAEEDGHAVSAA